MTFSNDINVVSVFNYLNAIETDSLEDKTVSSKLYVNINTGEFASELELLSSKKQLDDWKIIHITKNDGNLDWSLDSQNTIFNPTALEVLGRTFKQVKSSFSAFKGEMLKADSKAIQDSEYIRKNEVYFAEIQARLSTNSPIDEREIKSLYQQLFHSSLGEISNKMKQDPHHICAVIYDLNEAVIALETKPLEEVKVPTAGNVFGGANGSYFIKSTSGEKLWVFKPADEEKPDLMEGIVAGQGAGREQLAYLLNTEGVYPIPFTTQVVLREQSGSMQRTIKSPQSVHGLTLQPDGQEKIKEIPKKEIQASLVFDMRFNNWDRHNGNLLVSEEKAFMIDHGACMSSSPNDLPKMEQLSLPQASDNWDEELLSHILSLNELKIDRDAALMQEHHIPQAAIDRMRSGTRLLTGAMKISQESADQGESTLSPYDLGMFFLKEHAGIWEGNNHDSHLEFFKELLEEKKIIKNLGENPSRAKITLIRRKYAAKQNNPKYVEMLYGADPNNESPDRIDWKDSLLGKFLQINNHN